MPPLPPSRNRDLAVSARLGVCVWSARLGKHGLQVQGEAAIVGLCLSASLEPRNRRAKGERSSAGLALCTRARSECPRPDAPRPEAPRHPLQGPATAGSGEDSGSGRVSFAGTGWASLQPWQRRRTWERAQAPHAQDHLGGLAACPGTHERRRDGGRGRRVGLP